MKGRKQREQTKKEKKGRGGGVNKMGGGGEIFQKMGAKYD